MTYLIKSNRFFLFATSEKEITRREKKMKTKLYKNRPKHATNISGVCLICFADASNTNRCMLVTLKWHTEMYSNKKFSDKIKTHSMSYEHNIYTKHTESVHISIQFAKIICVEFHSKSTYERERGNC